MFSMLSSEDKEVFGPPSTGVSANGLSFSAVFLCALEDISVLLQIVFVPPCNGSDSESC